MVLIITDPIERKRWEAHLKMTQMCKKNTTQYKADEQKIIKMSASGASIKDIDKEVPGSMEKIITVRTRARRMGLL